MKAVENFLGYGIYILREFEGVCILNLDSSANANIILYFIRDTVSVLQSFISIRG